MPVRSEYSEAVKLLLASISKKKGTGFRSSFLFKSPNDLGNFPRQSVTLYYDFKKLNLAALHIRRHGANYLKFLSLPKIASMLQDFVLDHYYILAESTYLKTIDVSFDQAIADQVKRSFTDAFVRSCFFQPQNQVTAFPLVPVQVKNDFISEVFSIIAPASLAQESVVPQVSLYDIKPEIFPPTKQWDKHVEKPNAWLVVPSPAQPVSWKMRSAILGALALTPVPRERYLFSQRQDMFGGFCTFGDSLNFSFGDQHTPGLAHDIILTTEDHNWLMAISQLLEAGDKASRRKLKVLEYFYRAWPLDKTERFPIHCMVLDGLFGRAENATQAIVQGMQSVLGSSVEENRLRLLIEIRGDVIHGRAPDVYDTKNYEKYFKKYEADPIDDLAAVTEKSLAKEIFNNQIRIQPDSNAAIILEMQARGDCPPDIPSILN